MTIRALRSRGAEPAFVAIVALATAALLLLPPAFPSPYPPGSFEPAKAAILAVDNSLIKILGPVKEGEQLLQGRILTGRFAGTEFRSSNNLIGKLELDKFFAPGDRAYVVVDLDPATRGIAHVNVLDHYRLDLLGLLVALFFLLLAAFGGWTGLKSVLSFVFAAAALFKLLMPAMLKGWPPVPTSLALVAVLVAAVIFLVGGLTRRALAAYVGSLGGVLATAALAAFVTRALKIHGAVRPFAENLLYSGFGHLDLSGLFVAGIFLASSGAVMDIAMDIAAAMDEVLDKSPAIPRRELVGSGLVVGRQVIGTMTTTLLLAYSSGYSALIMTFIAQGVPTANALNMVLVSSELAHTIVGSFGLVLVAPLTAVAGGLILGGGRREEKAGGGDRRGESPKGRAVADSGRNGETAEAVGYAAKGGI